MSACNSAMSSGHGKPCPYKSEFIRQTRPMKTLLVVGGVFDFSPDFPELNVVHRPLNEAKWLLGEDNTLHFLDRNGALRVDGVLWRVGAIRAKNAHRHALELIRLAKVPCVNSAQTLLRGFERLSMLAELREVGVATVPFSVALGERVLEAIEPQLPCVLKIGNWHGGVGKAKLESRESWLDARDLALAGDDYATTEPFIEYRRDVRVLVVGSAMWAMERQASAWKVNRGTAKTKIIQAPDELANWTKRVQLHLNADILGLDWIESNEGKWTCLESNDVPGLAGWPDDVRRALVEKVRERMEREA